MVVYLQKKLAANQAIATSGAAIFCNVQLAGMEYQQCIDNLIEKVAGTYELNNLRDSLIEKVEAPIRHIL